MIRRSVSTPWEEPRISEAMNNTRTFMWAETWPKRSESSKKDWEMRETSAIRNSQKEVRVIGLVVYTKANPFTGVSAQVSSGESSTSRSKWVSTSPSNPANNQHENYYHLFFLLFSIYLFFFLSYRFFFFFFFFFFSLFLFFPSQWLFNLYSSQVSFSNQHLSIVKSNCFLFMFFFS
jgi:hypothetical protein